MIPMGKKQPGENRPPAKKTGGAGFEVRPRRERQGKKQHRARKRGVGGKKKKNERQGEP